MKKTILAFVMAIVMSVSASAQSWSENLPQSYLSAQCKLVVSPTSECNKGEEPFSKFLAKFNTSKKFRQERVRITSNTLEFQNEGPMLGNYVNALPDYNAIPLKAVNRRTGFKTWFNVSADMVCYYFPGGYICFERVDGLWYVVAVNLAG